MDIPQLKLLAGLVRGLLEQHDVPVGHSQSLDLIAALPGLRNWPEVNAFPDRVAACELNSATASRLAHRLLSRHGVELTPSELVTALSPPAAQGAARSTAPQIWPAGPAPGVYVTTSQKAIDALLRQYDEATDGELVYAEAAGSGWDGAIDLGEYGLSSKGLSRVPSGTLVIVGPVELNEGAWEDTGHKLDWACIRAGVDGHRVAVLIDTPQPELMFKDIALAVQNVSPNSGDCDPALVGIVADGGELLARSPFVQPVAVSEVSTAGAPTDALPQRAVELLADRLQQRSTGFLVLSSCVWKEHFGIEQIAAALPLTESVGPAARIKSRNRGTPAKDMMVPDVVKALPFMSSIDSAYAHGYRRMLVDASYADVGKLMKYADEVLFFVGGHSLEAAQALLETVRFRSFDSLDKVYDDLVACIAVGPITVADKTEYTLDVFMPDTSAPSPEGDLDVFQLHVDKHRAVRWEDELTRLLDEGLVTPDQVRASLEHRRTRVVDPVLTRWLKRQRARG